MDLTPSFIPGLVGRRFWLVLQSFQLYVVLLQPLMTVYRSIQAQEGRSAIWYHDSGATWGGGNALASDVSWHMSSPELTSRKACEKVFPPRPVPAL